MTPEQSRQVREVLGEALEQKTEDRPPFLDRACSSNPWLREEVERRLSSSDEARSSFLQSATLQITLTPGAKLGDYEVRGLLGSGGMGEVYRGRDPRLGREVAIKVLPAFLSHDPDRLRRFEQEARAVAALNHPNILAVFQMGTYEGAPYLVSELLEGSTLREHIVRGPLLVRKTIDWGVQIARGLAAAHEKGIVHRDLKPENVFVTKDGRVKILDFGLAKLTQPLSPLKSGGSVASDGTEPGVVMGTIGYMAPEQVRGQPADPRADIFAFGTLLYEMLSRKRAFQKPTSVETLTAVLNEDPAAISLLVPAIAPALQRIVHRCLEKNPQQRFQSASDLAFALEALSDSGSPSAKGQVRSRRISRWASLVLARRSLFWGSALLVLLMFAGFAAWFLGLRTKTDEASPITLPLTTYPGTESYPSLSPDGNQVAFSWNGEKQDNYDIYIKLIGPGEPLRLTTNPADDYSPAWSPDGRSIAFLRHLGGNKATVLVMPALGGAERELAEINETQAYIISLGLARNVAWSPDNKWVTFPDEGGLFALSIETGERQKLTSPPARSYDTSPAFAPDGHTVAFIRGGSFGIGEMYLQALSENLTPRGEARRVTDNRTNMCPVWTSDGWEIIFAAGSILRPSLWRIAASGSGNPQRLAFGDEGSSLPSISRLGHHLVYVSGTMDTNIWRIDVSASGGKNGSQSNFIHSTRLEAEAQYSPDGRRITFVSNRSGSDEIWVCNSDGSSPRQLTSLGGPHNGAPRWSPDGKHITFVSFLAGSPDVYILSTEGGKPKRLTGDPSGIVVPSWSRDGKWIYFTSDRTGESQVWKMPASGGQPVQVTRKGGIAAFESPDGRFLYYSKDSEAPTSLWKVAVEGGEETLVLEQIAFWSTFAVGDAGIYFLRLDMVSGTQLEFLDFATSRVKTIANIDKPWFYDLTVSPDGRYILYTRIEQQGNDLMLVENFH